MEDEQAVSRARIFKTVIFIVILVITGRLWLLQIIKGPNLKKMAEGNRIRIIEENAPRGAMLDRNGKEFVVNNKVLILAVSQSIAKNENILELLSKIVSLPKKEIITRINRQGKKLPPLVPRKIIRNIDIKVASIIKENGINLPGVEVIEEPVRSYPNGVLASHILGYLGEISAQDIKKDKYADYAPTDNVGKAGIERSYESILKGQKGGKQLEVDSTGRPTRILSSRESVSGHSIALTLDLNVQKITEKALQKALKSARRQGMRKARAGAAVVLDPNSGEIIAMASMPTYDLSLFTDGISFKEWNALNAKKSYFPLHNRAIMAVYPPGSTFKAATALSALEAGTISPRTTFVCKGKWTAFGKKWTKYCWNRRGHGKVSLNKAIVESCDVYFYEVGYKLYKKKTEDIQKFGEQLGFAAPTGIDLPWEKKGRLPNPAWKKEFNQGNPEYQTWLPGDNVNMAIGQGDVLATPLQLANAYAAIANGGTLYRPHVVKKIISADKQMVRNIEPEIARSISNQYYLRLIRRGLEGVVSDGTAKGAFSGFPLRIAGKTGTSQVLGKDDMSWFVGYGPLPNPKYVVVVVVEEGGHGGSVAAPAVRQILGEIYNLPENISNKSNVRDNSR